MVITHKEAVRAVYAYLEDLSDAGSKEYFKDSIAEEIRIGEDNTYIITLCHVVISKNDDIPLFDEESYSKTNEYRYFKVNGENANVEWMGKSLN